MLPQQQQFYCSKSYANAENRLLMKIRSITCFIDPEQPMNARAIALARTFLAAARPAFESAGYEVQTARLATVPFPYLAAGLDDRGIIDLACALEQAAREQGYDYISLGSGAAR